MKKKRERESKERFNDKKLEDKNHVSDTATFVVN